MEKILLYYIFVPLSDPQSIRLWQKTLCQKLNLRGRIIIAEHGINGTLGGTMAELKAYIKETKSYPAFKDIHFKWSEGSKEHFPRLMVKVRPEIVSFGVPEKIKVNKKGIIGGGKHLRPEEVHQLVAERPDVIFFDGRNAFEAAVGKFKNAIVPDVMYSRDFATELQKAKYDALKDKPVITYCTGGIRCEVISMLMKKQGFKEVYQLDGGIASYGQTYADDGLWEGSLYVFDDRMGTKFSDKARDIGVCSHCQAKTSNYENCAKKACNQLILICKDCLSDQTNCQQCLGVGTRHIVGDPASGL